MRKTTRFLTIIANSLMVLFFSTGCHSVEEGDEWKAPPDAKKLVSPVSDNPVVVKKGEELYLLYCRNCHGPTGYGNGPARGPLGIKPANFHDKKIKRQSNGELFWKISNGRKDMPSFAKELSEEQRWQLVYYLRNLPEKVQIKEPVALRTDIEVEHFMKTAPQAVRILQNPTTGELWYTTFDGNVFRIKIENGQKISEKMLGAQDHGIAILQGAAFIKNTLFLCGNVYSPDKVSTWGRMVRCELDVLSQPRMSVVFNTVKYAANKTIYDHGWNAMVVSPDEKYIYVNSGARTDHGEIQDNGGAYPNARDNALTAKIFRFPADAKDLLLPDDEQKLIDDGYLQARGIRNAYDMSFDPDGNLFAVSNSADYDYPEDMFWIRQGHHYGFPWVMGGLENPQQYKDWKPDPDNNLFINKRSHSWETNYYYNDPEFPARPHGIKFSPGVLNMGPDANEYRGHSGKIHDGDETGVPVSTFTAHCCPLGLFFDTKKILAGDLNGDGFVLRYSLGERSGLMSPFTSQGADLLHLQLDYVQAIDNYVVRTVRIVEGFTDPVDAVMTGNEVYVIEYDGKEGNIWKIKLPAETKRSRRINAALNLKIRR